MAPSDETIIGSAILEWLLSKPGSVIHAWHPPSSKAYFGPLVRIPKRAAGAKGRERYHLDGVIQFGQYLLLVELKGNSAGLDSDERKLTELMDEYRLQEFLEILKLRVGDVAALASVSAWVPAYGYLRGQTWLPRVGLVFTLNHEEVVEVQFAGEMRDLRSVLV